MLENVRFVLVNTYHPGNIGAVARAMKTMGLSQLYLVAPQQYPSDEAVARAAGAADLLEAAVVVDSLEQAIDDCVLVVGTSARTRNQQRPLISPEGCAELLHGQAQQANVALVFGTEKIGLTNAQLDLCQYHACVATSPEYPVLNIAAAAQIFASSLWLQADKAPTENVRELPSQEQREQMFDHLQLCLQHSGYLRIEHPGKTMDKLRTLLTRAQPDAHELQMLRGVFASFLKLQK